MNLMSLTSSRSEPSLCQNCPTRLVVAFRCCGDGESLHYFGVRNPGNQLPSELFSHAGPLCICNVVV